MSYTYAGQYGPQLMTALGLSAATKTLISQSVNVYQVGTTTAVTLYTDRTKGTPQAQPITADANGNLTFYADPGRYDIVFTPNGGTQQRVTVDVGLDPGEFVQGPRRPVNVKDYGATGDGVANDTTAIANALTASLAGSRPLYFPAGTYLTDQISMTGTAQANLIQWLGDGFQTTVIKKRTADGNPLVQLNATTTSAYLAGITFSDLCFTGQAGNSPAVVLARDTVRSTFNRCRFTSGIIGFQTLGGIGNEFHGCTFDVNQTGFQAHNNTTGMAGSPNLNLLHRCVITGNTTYGVDFDHGTLLTLADCDIESNGTSGNASTGGVIVGANVTTNYPGVIIQRCWLEANAGDSVVTFGSGFNRIADTHIVANPNATNDVKVTGGTYVLREVDSPTSKTTSLNDTTASSPNVIDNCTITGGLTYDAAKTTNTMAAWEAFTCTLGGTGWAIGNGFITARYKRGPNKTVHVIVEVAFGSTSTYGTVSPTLSLPLAIRSTGLPTAFLAPVSLRHNSAGSVFLGAALVGNPDTTHALVQQQTTGGQLTAVTSTSPFTWAANDNITLNFTYEAA